MKEEKIDFSTIHVDLDSLVDTRLGTLIKHNLFDINNREHVEQYFKREIDEFPSISFNDFKDLYDKRDKSVLRLSVGTHINHLLRDFCCSTLVLPMTSPWTLKPRLCLNIYPYQLTEEEETIIMKGMIASLRDLADIYIISLSNEELTPEYVKEKFSMFIKYDMFRWLDTYDNETAFEKIRIPEIGSVGPAIFYKDPRKEKEFQNYIAEGNNPFKELCKILKPVINLTTLPVAQFSAKVTGVNDKVEKIF